MNSRNRLEKIAGTPRRCFIRNENVNGRRIPRKLDKQWYIEVARSRIHDFLGTSEQVSMFELEGLG